MSRAVATAVVWLALTPLVFAQALQFRATTDAVTVDVSVRDRSRVVTGLTGADFELRDNGVPQTVLTVSYGTLPIDVTIALDISLSVDGQRLEQLRRAVAQLMRDLGPDDRLSLLTFNMRVSRRVEFTRDVAAVDRALTQVSAGGGTSIWDTAATVLAAPPPAGRRHLLVMFTDGADSTSITTPRELIALAQRMNTTVSAVVPSAYVFAPFARTQLPAQGPGQAALNALAAETGGSLVRMVGTRQDLGDTFRRLLEGFRTTYVLHYQPQGVSGTGFHTLEVAVKDKPGYTVTARRGYVR